MLQHLGACKASVLGDVAHKHQGGARGLGPLREDLGASPDLSHASRAALELGIEEGLDGVDHQEGRLHVIGGLQDGPDVRLGKEVDAGVLGSQAAGPELDLALALFA